MEASGEIVVEGNQTGAVEAATDLVDAVEVDPDVRLGPMETLAHQVIAAHHAVSASTVRLLDTIAALDAAEGYLPRYQDTATWVRWHLGVDSKTAHHLVRTARSLSRLPALRQAYGSGSISLDQLTVVLREASADNESELLAWALDSDDIEALRVRIAERSEERRRSDAAETRPRLRASWRDDALHLRGTIPGADGVMIEKALLTLAARVPKDERTGLFRDADEREGEALVQMASQALESEGRHDRATLVVHISANDLVSRDGDGWDAASRVIPAAELQRLACDARIQPALHDADGVTVGVGRTTRTIAPWLRRLLEARDRGCRFPGCGRARWLHGHHIQPWSQDGPTNLDNLVSLCGFHHRMIHRDAWSIRRRSDGAFVFCDRFGVPQRPPPVRFPRRWADIHQDLIESGAERRLAELSAAVP